jgi:hypothetical protein
MSHATHDSRLPKRPKRRSPSFRLRIWRCGQCNTACKTVLGPGGLCAVCRKQPPLPNVDDWPSAGGGR